MSDIENLIESGLPSAIYILSIPEPITGYKIGKKMQLGSRTTKIYDWINGTNGRKGLIDHGYIIKSEEPKGYQANIDIFLDIIEVENESEISKKDRKILTNILNSNEFKDFFKKEIISEIEFPSDIRSFYGIDYLFETISLITGIALAIKVYNRGLLGDNNVEELIEELSSLFGEMDEFYFSNDFHLLTDDCLRELAKMSEVGYWTGYALAIGWYSNTMGVFMGIEICKRLFKNNKKVQSAFKNKEKLAQIAKEVQTEWREQLKSEIDKFM